MNMLLDIARRMHETMTLAYFDQTSDEEIFRRIGGLSDGLAVRKYNLIDQTVFRARIGKYSDVPSLLYPPGSLIKSYGRLNGIGESQFYCATQLEAALHEVRSQVGDIVTVMETTFDSITALGIGMDLHSLIGSHPSDFQHALQGRMDIYSHAQGMRIEDLVKSDMANAYFHRLITSPGNPHIHRLTGLFSKHLYNVHDVDGIMYPCTVSTELSMRYGAGNIALKPDFVDRYAQHKKIYVFEVVGIDIYETKIRCIEKNLLPANKANAADAKSHVAD